MHHAPSKSAGASKLDLSVEEEKEQASLGALKTIDPIEENVQEVLNECCKKRRCSH